MGAGTGPDTMHSLPEELASLELRLAHYAERIRGTEGEVRDRAQEEAHRLANAVRDTAHRVADVSGIPEAELGSVGDELRHTLARVGADLALADARLQAECACSRVEFLTALHAEWEALRGLLLELDARRRAGSADAPAEDFLTDVRRREAALRGVIQRMDEATAENWVSLRRTVHRLLDGLNVEAPAPQPAATAGVRAEHRALYGQLERFRTAALAVGGPMDELRHALGLAEEVLRDHLIPHMMAEEVVLYPAVERAMGAAQATAPMRADHVEISRLGDELTALHLSLGAGPLSEETVLELHRVLWGLHLLVPLHLRKEDEHFLPLLDERLTAGEAAQLVRDLSAAHAH